ncbi:hypothetical protein [Fusibacter sp. JL216-2]|uniref:hypothetical protein n=1 Tax=Fusibacter sp. JL216-2 TaxID=3071453 RepID=UPI003D344251
MTKKSTFQELTSKETLEINGGTVGEFIAIWTIIDITSKATTGKSVFTHANEATKDYDSGGSTWGINGY